MTIGLSFRLLGCSALAGLHWILRLSIQGSGFRVQGKVWGV